MTKKPDLLYIIGISLLAIAFLGWVFVFATTLLGTFTGLAGLQVIGFGFSLLLPVCGCLGMAVLLVKVIRDRIRNKEDDYYSRNVER